jgi:transposase-like protein
LEAKTRVKEMRELGKVGDFCPNTECRDYGKTSQKNIIRFGQTKAGRQRFRCKSCGQTFNERKGTLFYQRKTEEKEIIECLAMLAEGMRISSISRVKGIKEDTILSFLRQAAQHASVIEAILLNDYQIASVQIDALWTYVGRKETKKSQAN